MEEIKRYQLFTQDDGDGFPYTDEEEMFNGDWVKYTDHKSVVDKMQAEIDQLKSDRLEMASLIEGVRFNILQRGSSRDLSNNETFKDILLTLKVSTLQKAEKITKES